MLKVPILFIPQGMVILKRTESLISDHSNIQIIWNCRISVFHTQLLGDVAPSSDGVENFWDQKMKIESKIFPTVVKSYSYSEYNSKSINQTQNSIFIEILMFVLMLWNYLEL